MFSSRLYQFCVATILCIFLSHASFHAEMCAETEKQALLKLKEGFVHEMELLSSWNGDDCCKWKGVSCNNLTGHVTSLHLRFSNFTIVEDLNYLLDTMPVMEFFSGPTALGGMIDSSICELQHLTFLDLSHNDLVGEIPKCIGSLGQLTQLKLAWNGLNSVSDALSNLSNLQYLDLRKNDFVASDLNWLSHLSTLRYLDLSKNNLGAVIDWPSSISKIPFLSELYLNDCGLPQVNPESINHINSSTFLQILSLSGNNFDSSILSWVLNVSKVLTVLDLSHNELDGGIIKSFNTLCQLKKLYLGSNKLSDLLSDYLPEFCSAKDLEVLNLDHNAFVNGSLPDFSMFSSLERLSLQNTSIVGPLSFGHLPRLKALDLSLNNLSGSLPVFEVTKYSSLHFLDLSHNKLSGTLPYTIGQLSNLWFLSISSNELNGNISEEHLSKLSGLKIFDVSQNSLSFNLNSDWIPPFQLVALYASSCILGPQFPMWLKQQRKLQVLQISNTHIMDVFPEWFGDISSSLLYINVSQNKLSGVLPKSLSEMCAETEKQALLKLKEGFVHQTELLSSWNGDDCCKWKGVSCNNLTGHVTSLHLTFSNFTKVEDLNYLLDTMPVMEFFSGPRALGGRIDSSICELQDLTFLDLSHNHLVGEIPKCIGSLGQLTHLKLAWNGLNSVSDALSNLSNLQYLDLEKNDFVASDLNWLSHLSTLRYLDLSNNNLGAVIDWPSSISKIPFLSELHLNDCRLPQVNPKSISHVNSSTFLQILSLSGNNFDSSILSWVLNVSKVLTVLDLSHNELDGGIIKSFNSLCQLKKLYLGSNKLSDLLSDYLPEFCSAKDLEVLNLDHNPFGNGSLPDFSMFSSLERLSLENTSIVGPLSFGHLPRLKALDLSLNNLSGSLPVFEVTKFSSLHFLDLSHNKLSGTLPYTIGQLSNLWFLSISSNEFNGNISEEHLLKLSGLKIFDVSQNSLSFNLSSDWVPPFQLVALYASSCILGSQFPMWLKQQRKLQVLQISNTHIMDVFPEWFGDISSSLLYINVSHNKLSGVLPKSLSGIKTGIMCTWDFSFNNLSGPLPPFPPKVYKLFLSNNMFTGFESSFCETSPLFVTYLELYSNARTGPLPNCWQKFQNLEILNLANNSLSGTVPESFGNLQSILWMQLNSNNFSGEIPSLSLCKRIRFIDFGDNNLEGTLQTLLELDHLEVLLLGGLIPQGYQLDTFDNSSYVGNIGLCGWPLENQCPGDVIPPRGRVEKNEDQVLSFEFYLSLGLGFCVGFWSVCGTLMVKSSWRRAYFQLFITVSDWMYVTVVIFVARMKTRFRI
ncbi:hypothetical protein ACSQ67_008453 [Phaseolus vulgaris]